MARAAQEMSNDMDTFIQENTAVSHSIARSLDEKQRVARQAAAQWTRDQAKRAAGGDGESPKLRPLTQRHQKKQIVMSLRKTLWNKRPSLAKLEIMRDFVQTMSLVFTNLYSFALKTGSGGSLLRWLEAVQILYRGMLNALAADFAAIYLTSFDDDSVVNVFLIFFTVVIAIAFLVMLGFATALVFGWDPKWKPLLTNDEKEEEKRRQRHKLKTRLIAISLALCQAVHLPAARLCVEILLGRDDSSSLRKRYRTKPIWRLLSVWAWFLLAYVIGLILLLIALIHRSAPRVITDPTTQKSWRNWFSIRKPTNLLQHDGSSKLVPFHNSMYVHLVETSDAQKLCPYRSLYSSFEWRWRYYKVFQLVIKVLLTVSLIPVSDSKSKAYLTLGWTTMSSIMTVTAPYIDDYDDIMEVSAKWTATVTCAGGVYLAYFPMSDNWVTIFVAFAVNFTNVGTALLITAFTCFGLDGLRSRSKNFFGRLRFSDNTLHKTEAKANNVLPKWNLDLEIRHRVWHAFWRKNLGELGQHEALVRLDKQLSRAMQHTMDGGHFSNAHYQEPDEYVSILRALLKMTLEGPDVYYEPPSPSSTDLAEMTVVKPRKLPWKLSTHDTSQAAPRPARPGFGKLTVVQYPFYCVVEYDGHDGAQIKIVDDWDVAALLFTNYRCDIVKKRTLRQKLRALSAWGGQISLSFENDETWEASDGRVFSFRCHYTEASVSVGSGDSEFNVSIDCGGGCGDVVDSESGAVLHHVTDRCCHVHGERALTLLGINGEFDVCDSDAFQQVLAQTRVADALTTWLPHAQSDLQRAREMSVRSQDTTDSVLGDTFLCRVYNNHRISRRALEKFLTEEETNVALRQFPMTHRASLDELYERLKYVQSDERIAYWFVFWHDVYEQNVEDIKVLQKYRHDLDPNEPSSMCYRMLPRDELRVWLKKRELWGKWQGVRHWLRDKRICSRFGWQLRGGQSQRYSSWPWDCLPEFLRWRSLFHESLLKQLYANLEMRGGKPTPLPPVKRK